MSSSSNHNLEKSSSSSSSSASSLTITPSIPATSSSSSNHANIGLSSSSYTVEEIPVLSSSESVIAALYSRIESVLSIKSGFTLSQLEIDPNYISTKSQLTKLADSQYIDDMVICTINILDSLNKHDNNAPLNMRKIPSLRSIAAILRLLVLLLNEGWDNLVVSDNNENNNKIGKPIFQMVKISVPQSTINGRQFRMGKPRRLASRSVKRLLYLLSNIKTDNDILSLLEDVSNKQFIAPKFEYPDSDDDSIKYKTDSLIITINELCDDTIKYVAASNSSEYFDFLRNKFRRINIELLFIPRSDFLGSAYLTSKSIYHYLGLVKDVIQITKRQSQQNLILSYFAESLYSWAISRTDDYLKATKDPNVTSRADSLFEIAYKQVDFKMYHKAGHNFLSLLLTMLPKQFEKYFSDKHTKLSTLALRRTVGKSNLKQKYLEEFVQLMQKFPATAPSQINVMLVSCCVAIYEENNPMVKFARQMNDLLYKGLLLENSDYNIPNVDTDSINELRKDFYAAATMLNPKQMTERTKALLDNHNASNSHLVAITGGIRKLMEIPLMAEQIFPYLEELSPYLLNTFKRLAAEAVSYVEGDDDSISSSDSHDSMIDMMDVLQQKGSAKSSLTLSNTLSTTTTTNSSSSGAHVSNTAQIVNFAPVTATPQQQQQQQQPLPPLKSQSHSHLSHPSLLHSVSTSSTGSQHTGLVTLDTQFVSSSMNTASSSNSTPILKNIYRNRSLSTKVKSPFRHTGSSSSSSGSVPGSSSNSIPSTPTNMAPQQQQQQQQPPPSSSSSSSSLLTSPTQQQVSIAHSSQSTDIRSPTSSRNKSSITSPTTPIVNSPLTYVNSYSSAATASSSSNADHPTSERKQNVEMQDWTRTILINFFHIYRAFPFLTFAGLGPDVNLAEFESVFRKLITPIIRLLGDEDSKIWPAAKSFILSVPITAANTEPWKVAVAYLATSVIVDAVSKLSISNSVSQLKREKLLSVLAQFFEQREKYTNYTMIRPDTPNVELYHSDANCSRLLKNLEKTIFLGLFSEKIEIHRMSRSLLQSYYQIIAGKHHKPDCFESHNVDLAKAILSDKVPAGTMAVRKKLQDHLCALTAPSDTLLEVWLLMFNKVSLNYEMDTQSQMSLVEDSGDYGEYIASLGGIILSPDFADDPRQPDLEEKLYLFLNYKMVRLFSPDLKTRERSREVLCVSMHPYLCGVYLDLLSKNYYRFENALKNKEYHLCESMINLLRTISQVDYESLYFHVYEFWELNFKVLKNLNISCNEPPFLRLKLKFCKMQVTFLARLDDLSMHGNILKKNQYARVMANYLEESFNYQHTSESIDDKSSAKVIQFGGAASNEKKSKVSDMESEDLHFDLKVETSIILKIIFFRLPLDTVANTGRTGKDDMLATNVTFSNYFNLFVRILERFTGMNKDKDIVNIANQRRSANIIKNIIQALINLLKSNAEVGLKYSLPFGYHEDNLIRVSFINVFSSIVKDLSIQMSSDSEKERAAVLDVGMNLFANDEAVLNATVQSCPSYEVDAFANALMRMTDDKEKELTILLSLLKTDILNTTDSVEILRSNTVATRMVALYSHLEASDYLISIFRPIFNQLIDTDEYFEIEKTNMMDDATKSKNLDNFMKYLTLIVDSIFKSVDEMPTGLRLISQTIYETTAITFPESKFAALGAFLFLRLFNPAIVAPERSNICNFTHQPFKRSLMQLARILQGMANETISGSFKWPLLKDRLDDLSKLKSKINHFMAEVIKNDDIKTIKRSFQFNDNKIRNYEQGFNFFHAYFYDHWLKIRQIYSQRSDIHPVSLEEKFLLIREIDDNMATIGVPKRIKGYEIPENIKNDKSEKGILLYDFMSQLSLSSHTGEIKPLVRESITQDGLPLIIMDFLNVSEDETPETACYKICQVLSKYWDSPYCKLIDCTGYTNDTLIRTTTEMFDTLVADKYKMNCKRYYYFNISQPFFQSLKDYKYFSNEDGIIVETEYVFLSFNDDAKSMSKYGLISYTNNATNDSRVSFHDVSIYQEDVKRFVPVKLKIGNEFLQIYSGQPQRIKAGNKWKTINLIDCYRIADIEDLSPSTITGVSNEISMIDARSDFRIILTSPKKVEIMRTLYFSRSRLNNDHHVEEEEENLETSVGQLININLSGLLSPNDDIRNSSFVLLTSLTKSFHLSIGRKIESANGVTFPYGDVEYIFAISASLAEAHPYLTYDFLYGFFNAFEFALPEDKSAIVIYTAPWIKNIYQHVFMADPLRGPQRTSELIKKFVRASRNSRFTTISFSMFIWSHLSLEDDLIETIIDEIIAAAIDHEAEGHDWEEITKFWPLTPTVEICGLLIRKIRDRSYSISDTETEIEAHMRWIETTVLARFLAYLVFDSLMFVEMFLSDIFYIVTIYMDYGPLEFRKCILKLVIRTFHSFLARDDLTSEQRESINNKVIFLNGARSRMLFGLTRDDDYHRNFGFNTSVGAEMVNKSHSVATVSEMLVSFMKEIFNPSDCDLMMIKWSSYVLKVAFSNSAQLQGRAILVLGSLTREGSSHSIPAQFMKTLIDLTSEYGKSAVTDTKIQSLTVCVLHSFTELIQGLPANSPFAGHFFWYSVGLSLLDSPVLYNYGTKFINATLLKISKDLEGTDKTVIDTLFEHRKIFGSVLEEFEADNGIKITRLHFDVIMNNIATKGITIPFTATSSYECLKTLLTIRYKEVTRMTREHGVKFELPVASYFLFLCIVSQSDTELINTLAACGLKDIEMVTLDHLKIPQLLIDFYSSDSPDVYAAAYAAINFFNGQSGDESLITRCLCIYASFIDTAPKISWAVFEMCGKSFRRFTESSTSIRMMEQVMSIMKRMMLDPDYKNKEKYNEELLRKVEESGMDGIRRWDFSNVNPFDSFNVDSEDAAVVEMRKRKVSNLKSILEKIYSAYADET
ncbi:hypothetical protein CANARDRAFT_29814 [[Candida] arabinofermentans NRRL YB-2248]|uniref:Ras-GAP domain-containing protein n=1 Tax=[Candida] arabinofermentans NRRL YB-2248 TaxID=983967 RepID=A0A1E4SVR2_9ASCO|nr:hypothetical protein CANARDRAFT_29814 [[Candida] arabinofermentans NRRL YB-2248]